MLNCVALAQNRSRRAYIKALGWGVQSMVRHADRNTDAELRPGEPAWLLSQAPDGQGRIAAVNWGVRSGGGVLPPALQARIEKAVNGRYVALWRHGRAVLPVDGWYVESAPLSGHGGCLVRATDRAPMFVAVITNFWIAGELPDPGFLIVSGESGEGVAGSRDCEPLVLAPEDAQLWLDPKLSADQARRLASALALDRDAFELQTGREPAAEAGRIESSTQPRMQLKA